MKKITFLAVALMVGLSATAQHAVSPSNGSVYENIEIENRDVEQVLSHSEDTSTFTGSVACADNDTGISTDNGFWRSYTPDDFGVTDERGVVGVNFAVGTATLADDGYSVMVNIYSSDATFPGGAFTLITSQEVPLTDADEGSILTVTLDEPFNVMPTDEVIIEIADASAEVGFRIGQNAEGQTAPSYLTSVIGCEISVPTPADALGDFPDNFIIDLVVDDPILSVGENSLSELVSVFPNPASTTLNISASNVDVKAVALYNVLGKQVQADFSNNSIDVSNLAAGVYILNIETSRGTLTQKVVKQ